MAKGKAGEPDKSKVIPKDHAMIACRVAMTNMLSLMCGGGSTVAREIPEGHTAEDVAAALGGTVLTVSTSAIGRRVVVVRIAVGLLTSSITANALPKAIYTIEHVQSDIVPGVAKVSQNVIKSSAAFDVIDVAKQIKATAPIVGDSILIKSISKSAATFNVFANVIETLQLLRKAASREDEEESRTRSLDACCKSAEAAFAFAWDKAPKEFHEGSYKTQTGVKRYYGKKPVRI